MQSAELGQEEVERRADRQAEMTRAAEAEQQGHRELDEERRPDAADDCPLVGGQDPVGAAQLAQQPPAQLTSGFRKSAFNLWKKVIA